MAVYVSPQLRKRLAPRAARVERLTVSLPVGLIEWVRGIAAELNVPVSHVAAVAIERLRDEEIVEGLFEDAEAVRAASVEAIVTGGSR